MLLLLRHTFRIPELEQNLIQYLKKLSKKKFKR